MSLNKSIAGLKIDNKLLRKQKAKKVTQGHKQDDLEQSMLI